MALILTPCPLFDQNSTGHYSEDNFRIDQLNINDQLIVDQLNSMGANSTSSYEASGSWATIYGKLVFPVTVANGSSFGALVKMWGIEDATTTSTQNSFIAEYSVMGYRSGAGILTILNQAPIYIQNIGSKTISVSFSVISGEIHGAITGFTGNTGKLVSRIEYFI